jgi:hypothetical protein
MGRASRVGVGLEVSYAGNLLVIGDRISKREHVSQAKCIPGSGLVFF